MQPSSQTSQITPSNPLESNKNKDQQLNLPVTLKNQGRQGSLRKYKHPSKGQLSICEQRERCFLLDGGRKTLNTPYYDGLKDKHLTEFLVKSTTLQLLKKHGVIKKFKQDGSNLVLYKDPLKDPLIRRNVFTTLPPIQGILSKPKQLDIESNKPFTREAFSSSAMSPLNLKQSELGTKPSTTTEQKSINYNHHGRSESEANFFKHSRKTASQENTNHQNKYNNSTAELKMREIVQKNGYREKNSSVHSSSTKHQEKHSGLERDEAEKQQDKGYLPLSGGQQQSEQKQTSQDTQLIDGHVAEESNGKQSNEQHGSPLNMKEQYSRQTPNNNNNSMSKESTNNRSQLLGYSPIGGKQKRPKFNQVLPPFKMYKCPKSKQCSNGGGESSSNISVNASMTKEDFTKMIGKFKEKVQNTLRTAETKGITILEENHSNLPSSHVKEGHNEQ